MKVPPAPRLFQSFWIGGFESACHINRHGVRLDMIAATQHDVQARQDYELLKSAGIFTVRDVVRWHLVDRGSILDYSPIISLAAAAEQACVQVIWNLCHYGWPEDIRRVSSTLRHPAWEFTDYLPLPFGREKPAC